MNKEWAAWSKRADQLIECGDQFVVDAIKAAIKSSISLLHGPVPLSAQGQVKRILQSGNTVAIRHLTRAIEAYEQPYP